MGEHTKGRRNFVLGAIGAGTVGAVAGGFGVSRPAVAAGDDPYSIDVVAHGADPSGQEPSDGAFRAAAEQLLSSFQPGGISGPIPKRVIVVPPGNYLLTEPGSLLPKDDGTTEGGIVDGISITGYGKRLSRITYSPTADDTTLWTNNQRYKNIRISGLTFDSTNPTSSFNYAFSSSTHGVQDTWYTDVEWRGSWKRGIGLDGPAPSNLNSEMGWDHCQVSGTYSDAFLVMGMTNSDPQQDQFLNYWFRDCKIEYESGVFVKNQHGGSMNFIGGSYILIDGTKSGAFFFLTPDAETRFASVCRLYVAGIRFELRGPEHKVIDSHWYKGNITFSSCDDTSHGFEDWAAEAVSHAYAFTRNGSRGPMVRYVDCALVSHHQVTTTDTELTAGKLKYDGCQFYSHQQGTGDAGFLRWTGGVRPHYEFRDCLAGSEYLPDETAP